VLEFRCADVRPEPFAAGPSLLIDLAVSESEPHRVHSIALRTQIRIEPRGRDYAPDEAARLVDLFGEPARWGETLHPLQLATVGSTVRGFTGDTVTTVTVPLTYDLDIAATKFCHGLANGVIPLLLLFSGTVFYQGPAGVQVGPVSWSAEARCPLPVATWRAAMDDHYPGSGYLRLATRTLDALGAYRSKHTITSWDETIERLLKEAGS